MKKPFQRSVPAPLLEVAVARLVWRVAARQLRPLRPGTKNPKHPGQHLPPLTARAAPAVLPAGRVWDQPSDTLPLGVREIQGDLPTRGVVAKAEPQQTRTTYPAFSAFSSSPLPRGRDARARRLRAASCRERGGRSASDRSVCASPLWMKSPFCQRRSANSLGGVSLLLTKKVIAREDQTVVY